MPCLAAPPYDVVFFLLDDMRFDQLDRMTETMERLGPTAVRFDRAYVTTPMCCPSRASILSGGYPPRETGVLTNEDPMGGAAAFVDTTTLATRLQDGGYSTALLGKYLNGYPTLGNYVPPGWTIWAATGDGGGWSDFQIERGSSTSGASAVGHVQTVSGYVTDWQGDSASALLSHGSGPQFIYLSFLAPHYPHVPAPGDAGTLEGYVYRDRAWEEEDVSDKPAWIQAIPLLDDEDLVTEDDNHQGELESLLAVDRAMATVYDAVEAAGRLDRTVFILSSDNGSMWNEHRLSGKGVIYEESVLVPLLISAPGLDARTSEALVAMNLDVPATIAALAGLEPAGEGLDLSPLLCGDTDTGRDHITLQDWESDDPTWAGVVTDDAVYAIDNLGEQELYDLLADPYEELSLHADPDAADRMTELAGLMEGEVGLVVNTTSLPVAVAGEEYRVDLESAGGTPPLTWSVDGGTLPGGVSLSTDGVLGGTPTETGDFSFEIMVLDAGSSPYDGAAQRAAHGYLMRVVDAPAEGEGEGEDTGEAGDTASPKSEPGCGCAQTSRGGAWIQGLLAGLLIWRRRQGRMDHGPPSSRSSWSRASRASKQASETSRSGGRQA